MSTFYRVDAGWNSPDFLDPQGEYPTMKEALDRMDELEGAPHLQLVSVTEKVIVRTPR